MWAALLVALAMAMTGAADCELVRTMLPRCLGASSVIFWRTTAAGRTMILVAARGSLMGCCSRPREPPEAARGATSVRTLTSPRSARQALPWRSFLCGAASAATTFHTPAEGSRRRPCVGTSGLDVEC